MVRRGFTSVLVSSVTVALLTLASATAIALAGATAARASGYGELLRFTGSGTNKLGSELELAGEETHAFAVNPETGTVYAGDETAEYSEKLRVQSYDGAGAFQGEATIKPPSSLPKGIGGLEGYEGFAVASKEKRIYALATYERFAEDAIDPGDGAAGALYALKSAANASGKLEPAEGSGKEGLLGSTVTLGANSETPGQALLEPSGLTVDPLTGEVLILGLVDEGGGNLHPAVLHVSSTGTVLFTWVDPATASIGQEPDSPVVTPGGKLLFEAGDELFTIPASAKTGAPALVFAFAEPNGFESGPFAEPLAAFGEGETNLGGGLSAISEGSPTEGRLTAFAEINAMTEAGEMGERRWGALSFHYTEAGEDIDVAELGWTGGVPGQGQNEKAKPCEIGFANANPSVAAASGDTVYVLAPAFSEVIELGPGGSGCPAAKEAPTGLEATIDGKRVANPEIGEAVTLTARVVQANVLSVTWLFGDGQEAVIATPAGEQTQTAETSHKFVKTGKLPVEAIIHTDDLATPELRVKTTVDVSETTGASPKITSQPQAQTIVEGQNAHFEASATGEPQPTAQWEVSTDGGEQWSTLSGQDDDKLELEHVPASDSGRSYRATFSNGVGTPVSSAAVTLTVETIKQHEENLRRRQQEEEAGKGGEEPPATHTSTPPAGEPKAEGQGSGSGQTTQSTQGVAGRKEASPRATLASSSLTVSAAGALTLTVQCPAGVGTCTGAVTLRTLTAVSARAGAKKSVLTLATGSFSLAGGQDKAITLHLSSQGRRLLSRSHSLHARATVIAHNGAGESQTVSQTITLRLAKAR